MQTLTDEEIAQKVQQGDSESFGLLIERYESKLMRYAKRFLFDQHTSEDMVQEVFLKAYTNIQSFKTDKTFSPWIYRIAHNHFINEIKKRKTESISFVDLDVVLPYLASPTQTDAEFQHQELKEAMKTCVQKIDLKYREPLLLYFFEDMSYKEIADIIHIPVSTVGVRITRAKKLLKKEYEQKIKSEFR